MALEESNPESEDFLEKLRKDIIHVVAQKLTYDLSNPDQLSQLKPDLASIVNHYLLTEGIAIKDEIRLELIDQLHDRLTSQARQTAPAHHPTDDVRTAIASHLAQFLSDEIEGEALGREITRLVMVKCKQDGIEITEIARAKLIVEMCGRMNVAPPPEITALAQNQPETPNPANNPPPLEPTPEPEINTPDSEDVDPGVPTVPEVSASANDEENVENVGSEENEENPLTAATAPLSTPVPRPLPKLRARGDLSDDDSPSPANASSHSGHSIPLKALTHEIKRELLYHLSQTIDPTIMGMDDEAQTLAHINHLIEEYCQEHRLTLTETEIERIIEEILSGEGLEFQL